MKEAAVRHYDLINSFASFNITGYFHEIFIRKLSCCIICESFPLFDFRSTSNNFIYFSY